MIEMNIPENILSDDIDQERFICIRLCLTTDNNNYNALFMQNFFLSGYLILFMRNIRFISG